MRTCATGFAAVSLGVFLSALTADAREQGPAGLTIQPARPAPTIGGVTVTGRVLVDEGRPRPVFQFALSDASGAWFSPSTDRSGLGTFAAATVSGRALPPNLPVFSMDLPAGDYRPVISGLPPGYTVRSIESGAQQRERWNGYVGRSTRRREYP